MTLPAIGEALLATGMTMPVNGGDYASYRDDPVSHRDVSAIYRDDSANYREDSASNWMALQAKRMTLPAPGRLCKL
jgi:hypothetical protein